MAEEEVASLKEEINKLKQINRKKDVIIDSTHDGMIAINSDCKVELFNQAAASILNLNQEDVIGYDVREVIPNTRLHIVLNNAEPELNRFQQVDDTQIVTNRVPVKGDNGEIIGAVAVFRDKTEVTRLAEEITNLKEIQGMLEAIINSTQDAISVVDENGIGILINPAYTRMTGLTEEDVIGKPADVDIAEGQSMHYKVLQTKEKVQGVRMKVGPQRKDVIVDVAPIMVDGELKGSVGVIKDVSEIKSLTEELDQARQMLRQLKARYSFKDIVGRSQTMQAVINKARKASQTPATVLLRGESGTGKELFAHAIHNESKRRNKKFIRVNCSALVDSLLESELFGYEEGAFTGAKKGGKKGVFEEADGGTIFLDEIGKISPNLQSKLLRVLQEREVVRVGGTRPISIDVRVIVATNINLERAIQEDRFREDLYYRLNVFPLNIPPLRDRLEDIKPLSEHIIRKFNQEYGRSVKGITDLAVKELQKYDWPGNVRELENIISQAMIHLAKDEDYIDITHLPGLNIEEPVDIKIKPKQEAISFEEHSLKEILNETEKKLILKALEDTNGNRTEAANLLGIAVRSLYYKLDKYGID